MMSGDADSYEDFNWRFEYSDELTHINFSNLEQHAAEVEAFAEKWLLLKKICNVNKKEYLEKHEDVMALHGDDIAHLYDNLPYDRSCDSYKAHIDRIELVGWNAEGTEFRQTFY